MKTIAVFLTLLACGCNWDAASREEIVALTARVITLENQLKQAESASDDLSTCLDAVNDAHDKFVLMNGGRRVTGKDGESLIRAPGNIWEAANKAKQTSIEECKTRYGGKNR